MGPEHGYDGSAGAGVSCRSRRHPDWGIPVHSLYGATRKPTPAMLKGVDVLVIDLQDTATRCYTYVSTLQLALEAASEQGVPVIVADRPIPLPNTVDGPVTDPAFSSFVGLADTPLSYGMTPAEFARWFVVTRCLPLDLRIARLGGYTRQNGRGEDWPPWMPPSPAMLSWESARCFPATVIFEAFPPVDHGRATALPFQVFGAEWTRGEPLAEILNDARIEGVRFFAHRYNAQPRQSSPRPVDGVRMVVTNPDAFRPAFTALHLIRALEVAHGRQRLWRNARPDWLDKLFATGTVRAAIMDGESPANIAGTWEPELRAFLVTRKHALLYRGRLGRTA
jgi:uncharacterized protein YbbC (DUF1343 family)